MDLKSTVEMTTVEDLENLIDQGLSVKKIAEHEDMRLGDVRTMVTDNGLAERLQDRSHWMWDEDENDRLSAEWMIDPRPELADLARIHCRSVGAISTRIRLLIREGRLPPDAKPDNKAKKWKPTEIEQLKNMVNTGVDWPDIAVALDRSENSVKRKFERVSNPKTGKPKASQFMEIVISGGGISTTVRIPRGDVTVSVPQLKWSVSLNRDSA